MDVRSGRIYREQELGILPPEDREYLKPMEYHPTPEQRATGRVGRNDVCPCGSGKKFKKCCLFQKVK